MKNLLASALIASTAQIAVAAPPLLTPTDLSAPSVQSAQLRIIDIRDPASYKTQHIPGAINAPYGQWRGPASNPGELPDTAKLTELVQSLGLTAASHAVVVSSGVDATDFGASARVYWTLKLLGLKDLSILNGGMQAWSQAKLATDSAVPQIARSNYQPQINRHLLATRASVSQNIKLSNATLVDSRTDAFYLGKVRAPAAKSAGTLPGAQLLDFNQWFVPGSAQFIDTAKAQQVAAQVQHQPGQEVVAFCNTGHLAATEWFGLSEVAGLPNVKLYAGSMVDWTQSKEALPIANQPGRMAALIYDAQQWLVSRAK